MSDRRPSKEHDLASGGGPIVKGLSIFYAGPDPDPVDVEMAGMHRASNAEVVEFVRRGVESGTIKGKTQRWCEVHESEGAQRANECRRVAWARAARLTDADINRPCQVLDALVIPVSDGGEDRP